MVDERAWDKFYTVCYKVLIFYDHAVQHITLSQKQCQNSQTILGSQTQHCEEHCEEHCEISGGQGKGMICPCILEWVKKWGEGSSQLASLNSLVGNDLEIQNFIFTFSSPSQLTHPSSLL